MCTHVDVLNQEQHSCPTTINIEMILLLNINYIKETKAEDFISL